MPKHEGVTKDGYIACPLTWTLCFVRHSSFGFRHFGDDGLSTVQFRQLAPDLAFAFGQSLRHVDLHNNIKIAALPGDARQTALAQAKPLATLCARWDFQTHVGFESWHDQFAAQHGAPRLDLYLVNQVTAFD